MLVSVSSLTIFYHLTCYTNQNGITCTSTFLSVFCYELWVLCTCCWFNEQSQKSKIEMYRGFWYGNWAWWAHIPSFLGRLDEWDRSTESGDAGSSRTEQQEAESCEVVGGSLTNCSSNILMVSQSVSVGRSWWKWVQALLFHSHPQHHSAD